MIDSGNYSVHGPKSTGEAAGIIGATHNDQGFPKPSPQRKGRKARRGTGRSAARTGEGTAPATAAGAPAVPDPVIEDDHVDYYI
jgi:hypothetical protein